MLISINKFYSLGWIIFESIQRIEPKLGKIQRVEGLPILAKTGRAALKPQPSNASPPWTMC